MRWSLGLLVLAACAEPDPRPTAIDLPWPDRPAVTPGQDGDGRPIVTVRGGRLPDLDGRSWSIAAGPQEWLVVFDPEGTDDSRAESALWIRGWGSTQHLLPQVASLPIHRGTQEPWTFELPAGEYTVSVTVGGTGGEGLLLNVR